MFMKKIKIYIFGFFVLFFVGTSMMYASSQKDERSETRASAHSTQHPPHDHQQTDHIKKLDEGIRRRRVDEKESD